MDSLEKKRLLPALTSAGLVAALAVICLAQDADQLKGIRTESDEKNIVSAEKFVESLGEPDFKRAEKFLRKIRSDSTAEKWTEDATDFLSTERAASPPSAGKNVVSARGEPKLFYFFSFSMPVPTLRDAARDTAATGGVMVLRGLAGANVRETAFRVSEIVGNLPAEVWIDPFLFGCFGVEAVPELVLARNFSEGNECEKQDYVKVSGDISVSLALEAMEGEDENAGTFLGKIREGGFYGD